MGVTLVCLQPLHEGDLSETPVEFFDVELVKGTQGLGITIAGYIGEKSSGKSKAGLLLYVIKSDRR